MYRPAATLACLLALTPLCRADDPPAPPKPAETPAPKAVEPAKPTKPAGPRGVAMLRAEAAKLLPLAESDAAKAFLNATETLPAIEPRPILRDRQGAVAVTPDQADQLTEVEREGLVSRDFDEHFYYYTGFGSPLVYARVVDVLAAHGVPSLAGKRLMDFGYGTIGHLRLLGATGCDAHGVDVQPLFGALYSAPSDTGVVRGHAGAPDGRVAVHTGRWPADAPIAAEVGKGGGEGGGEGGYDVITSKNTLKRGYIHPERPADEKELVKLGVDDETFLRTVHESLKPGGVFLIYNIAGPQNPPDKPFLPMADGRCPFERAQLERAGFEVVEFDRDDAPAIYGYWRALGYDRGASEEDLKKSIFAQYTLCRKAAAKP